MVKRKEKDYSVYIVKCRDKTLYTGIAKDVKARISLHNEGRGAKYTRGRLPVKLVYSENGFTKSIALKREREIKALSRDEKKMVVKGETDD